MAEQPSPNANKIQGKFIRSVPVAHINGRVFGPGNVPAFQYRFIDCKALVEEDMLQMLAFDQLPIGQYSALSYIWNGLASSKKDQKSFKAQGAESIGAISFHVIRSACRLSLLSGAPLLWLDCICILQTNPEDKAWQIQNMFLIYENCEVCIVLPAGLQRMARPRRLEACSWCTRRWTLQEAILPRTVLCLFHWSLGPGKLCGVIDIKQIQGESGMGHTQYLANW